MKLGRPILLLGIAAMLFGLLFAGKNLLEQQTAGTRSAAVTALLQVQIEEQSDGWHPQLPQIVTPDADRQTADGEEAPRLTYADDQMPTILVDGEDYIGVLEIPALDLSLPVMNQWSDERLKTAPCRFAGSAYQGNLIIAGHNYFTHFGHLKELKAGDSVCFTDALGNQFSYQVSSFETVTEDDYDLLMQTDAPLSLFTCTATGGNRLIVRCTPASG